MRPSSLIIDFKSELGIGESLDENLNDD